MDRALRRMKPRPLLHAGPAAVVPLAIEIGIIGSVGIGLVFLILPALGYMPVRIVQREPDGETIEMRLAKH